MIPRTYENIEFTNKRIFHENINQSFNVICNSFIFKNRNLCYFYEQRRIYKKYVEKFDICSNDSVKKLMSIYIDTVFNETKIRFSYLLITDKNDEKLYCYITSNNKEEIVVIVIPEYYVNSIYLSVLIYNEYNNENYCDIEKLTTLELLSPCSININFLNFKLFISTDSLAPRIDLNYNFVIKILACILSERQIVFYSKSSAKIFKVLIFFTKIIFPFQYYFFISSKMPKEIKIVLNSPFPFIMATEELIKTTYIFVGLDKYEIYNFLDDVLPFEKDLRKKFKEEACNDMNVNFRLTFKNDFNIIRNNLDIARESLINKNISKSLMIKKNC